MDSQDRKEIEKAFNICFVETNALVEQCQDYSKANLRIELTLNHPRTAPFKRLTYEQQCKVYDCWIDLAFSYYFPNITKFERCFEKCQDGTAHVHCDIWYRTGRFYNRFGVVSQFVKALLMRLPKRHGLAKWRDDNYDSYYTRYVSPSICLTVKDTSDMRRALEWETYIHKSMP